jgi:hypothetical protein
MYLALFVVFVPVVFVTDAFCAMNTSRRSRCFEGARDVARGLGGGCNSSSLEISITVVVRAFLTRIAAWSFITARRCPSRAPSLCGDAGRVSTSEGEAGRVLVPRHVGLGLGLVLVDRGNFCSCFFWATFTCAITGRGDDPCRARRRGETGDVGFQACPRGVTSCERSKSRSRLGGEGAASGKGAGFQTLVRAGFVR